MKKILLSFFVSLAFIGLHAQDECSSAIAITQGTTQCTNYFFYMTEATLSTDIDECSDPEMWPAPTADMWVTFEATASQVWLHGGYYVFYSGTCDDLVEVTCWFDNYYEDPIELTVGESYFIRFYSVPFSGDYADFCLGTDPEGITIYDDQYTSEELVTEILFEPACGSISNITSISSTNPELKSIGNFTKDGAYFPFESGVIMATEDINSVSGSGVEPNYLAWPGDNDLLVITPNDLNYSASTLEFDFTASAQTISFEYLFASRDYETDTQCSYIDAFAIFLTDLETGETVNIATVPGTNLPVTTQNIRSTYGPSCLAANIAYYTSQNYSGFNFNGNTVPLTATGTIIPDHSYHVKLAIADGGNNGRSSAVFIKSGSFGVDIPDDSAITDNNYGKVCSSGPTTLTVNIDNNFDVQWSHNGVAIDGATSHTYEATEGGTYSVSVIYPGADESCGGIFEHTLTYLDVNPEISSITVEDDNNDGVAQFDLNAITEQIIEDNELGVSVEAGFYLTAAQAEEAVSADNLNYAGLYTNISNPQTLYLRVQGFDNPCFAVTPVVFTVLVDEVPAPTGDVTQMLDEGATLADVVVTGNNIQWYSDAAGENLLPQTTVVADGVTYYASQMIGTVESITFLAVTIEIIVPTPAPTGETVQYFFENATLADLEAEGENIQWYASLEATEPLAISTLLINNTAYYASQTIDGLESEERLSVTAFVTSPAPEAEEEQTLPEGATLADLEVEGENIQWYDSPGEIVPGPPDSGIPLPLTTLLVDGTTYYASQTIDGIESIQRTPVTVSLSVPEETPAPEGAAEQTFNQGATLAEIDIDGENIKWYATEESTEVLPSATVLIDDTTYYATQTLSGLESTDRLGVTVNLILGDTDFAFSGFSYWPNPVKDILEVKNGEAIDTVVIYNLLGQRVALQEIHATTATVDFTSLERGIYLVELHSGTASKTIRIVKQ